MLEMMHSLLMRTDSPPPPPPQLLQHLWLLAHHLNLAAETLAS
jgi:hypothetical protein